jgi:hypothetical protein
MGGDRILLGIQSMGVRAGRRMFSRILLEVRVVGVFRVIL